MSDDPLRQDRESQRAAIEATWPDALRERLRSDAGEYRIYGIWRRTFLTGLFDPLRQFVDPARAAVDVGALLGQYSLTLAAWSTRCLCVEPLEHYRFVGRALPPNCLWRTVAAGAAAGHGTLYSPVLADGSVEFGLSSLTQTTCADATSFREQITAVRPLDEIIPEALGDEPVGFVKIDVEGHEADVIRGAARTLRRHRPNVLVETADVPGMRDLMGGLGYRGLFFFRRQLVDLDAFRPDVHRAAEHIWTRERAERFDHERVMSDLYFLPTSSAGP